MSAKDHNKMILDCMNSEDALTEWEREFINALAELDDDAVLIGKQASKLEEIHGKLASTGAIKAKHPQ